LSGVHFGCPFAGCPESALWLKQTEAGVEERFPLRPAQASRRNMGESEIEGRLGGEASSAVLTVPNLISLLRLGAIPVFAWLVVRGRLGTATLVLAGIGVSDWVDGWIARRFNQVSRLGQLLDPAADRLALVVAAVVFIVEGITPWWVVGLILLRDVAIAAGGGVLKSRGGAIPAVNVVGKAGTCALMYALPLFLLGRTEVEAAHLARVLGWVFFVPGIALYYFAGALYALDMRRQLGRLGRISR